MKDSDGHQSEQDGDGEQEKGQQQSFFEETSLHGLKYVKNAGAQRVLWISLLLLSLLATLYFMRDTLKEYFGDNMKVLLNSTDTPLTKSHFPTITLCNMNLVSRTLTKLNPDKTAETFQDAKELAQPCEQLSRLCFLGYSPCSVKQVLTDNGWCCQIDPRKIVPTKYEMNRPVTYMLLDIQSYDYAYPSWFGEGLLISADPHDSYPDFTGKGTFVTPGTNTMLRLALEKTYTTGTALSKSPTKRKCFSTDEVTLKHFHSYSQSNCEINQAVNGVHKKCGCVGRHRGFNDTTMEGIEECIIEGSLGWMFPLNYKQCRERNTSLDEVLRTTARLSDCMVNCDESRYTVELSTAAAPGFMAVCAKDDFHEHIACFFNTIGHCIGTKVCDYLDLYDTGLDKDEMHYRKRKTYCTDAVNKTWAACKDKVDLDSFGATDEMVECVNETNSLAELLAIKDALELYARENVVTLQVQFKGNYYTSVQRDVSYTFSSLVANLGGLLGLSMGCSMISIAELFILPMKNILCNKRKKTVEQDE